ncbi:hypothetical protein K501DRAFT_280348 [Backusella circina FSU 941]|nr:hypothetical protein K501DRAFT_280348 [Backusella circina FSU 941]
MVTRCQHIRRTSALLQLSRQPVHAPTGKTATFSTRGRQVEHRIDPKFRTAGFNELSIGRKLYSSVMSDIVDKYASNLNTFKLSEFLRHEKHFIVKMDYSIVANWKNLKQYWCSVCESYAISHQKKVYFSHNPKFLKFIKDSNVVDWDDIANQITQKQMKMDARQASYDLHAKINKEVADELASPFIQTVTITEKAFIIRAKIDEYRRNATYVNEVHCQDLLYYGVIDLVKNGTCATASILKDELEELTAYMKDHLEIEYKKSKTVKKYAKQLLKNIPDMKKLIKEEKNRLRGLAVASSDQLVDRKDMKSVVKIVKLFVQVTNNGERHNWLKEEMREAEYIARFTTPLIDLILKPCSTKMTFKPGEQKLHLVKDYENSALTDDDTRLPGPNIDGIIKNINLDIPLYLVEVSGSPNTPADNYSHYKGDRNKLAKNLKYLFKVVLSMKGVPSFESSCKIKLLGIHFYYDQVYVYSLSMPMWDVFVFKLELKFDIPIKPTLFPSTLPTFISKLFQLGELLDNFSNKLQTFLSINDYESSSSSYSAA